MTATTTHPAMLSFQTHPERYRHWRFEVDGEVATLAMNVNPEGGLRDDYELKLNSYDLGVDIELHDAIQRLRFEHPKVRCVVLTGALDRVFCAGANIVMLRTSTHAFKVNFCKFTNETRIYLEDASEGHRFRTLAALNGTASGGGYELALACDKILLVDDRSSAVSFPEVPLLGVLPGTGGLTRITDKRQIRRDRCDLFNTVAEGIKGKRALEWNLVDGLAPLSKFEETLSKMTSELAAECPAIDDDGVVLDEFVADCRDDGIFYRHVSYQLTHDGRVAELTLQVPTDGVPTTAEEARAQGADWWVLRAFRELDDALLHLRMNLPKVALVTVHTRGDAERMAETDGILANSDHWFVRETRQHVKRVLKRLENTAKSFYAVADEGSCFHGTLLELALACDRIYLLNDPDFPVTLGIGEMHGGLYPMANGLTRLQTRFLGTPEAVDRILASKGTVDAETADELGLATVAVDDIDWEDELRLAVEERTAFSPDALTGLESNLRFAGVETMETRIFGRLSAWQNWIFQRPNAVGERGALQCYGTPQSPEFNVERT